MRKDHRLFDNITIVIDNREQCPYRFGHASVVAGLPTGDYSLLGFETGWPSNGRALMTLWAA
ncbi:hypothetical protein ACFL4G_03685 [Thermodesulfobacteriota bacterium]